MFCLHNICILSCPEVRLIRATPVPFRIKEWTAWYHTPTIYKQIHTETCLGIFISKQTKLIWKSNVAFLGQYTCIILCIQMCYFEIETIIKRTLTKLLDSKHRKKRVLKWSVFRQEYVELANKLGQYMYYKFGPVCGISHKQDSKTGRPINLANPTNWSKNDFIKTDVIQFHGNTFYKFNEFVKRMHKIANTCKEMF